MKNKGGFGLRYITTGPAIPEQQRRMRGSARTLRKGRDAVALFKDKRCMLINYNVRPTSHIRLQERIRRQNGGCQKSESAYCSEGENLGKVK